MYSKKRIILIVLLSMLIVVISSVCCFADTYTMNIWQGEATGVVYHFTYTPGGSQSVNVNYGGSNTTVQLPYDSLITVYGNKSGENKFSLYYYFDYNSRVELSKSASAPTHVPLTNSLGNFVTLTNGPTFNMSSSNVYYIILDNPSPSLSTPSVEYSSDQNGVHLTWAPVDGALSYKFNYGGTSFNIGNVTSYTLTDFGEYTLQAVGENAVLSDPTPKIVYRQIQPVAGSFSNVSGNLIFERTYPSETENVSGYVPQYSYNNSDWVNTSMVVNDPNVPNYRVILADQPAYYHMIVYDIASGILTQDTVFDVTRPTESFYYDGTSVQPFAAPVLTLNDTLLSWTYPPGSTSSTVFEVYCNGSRVQTLTGNTYTITQSGTWYVRALGSGSYSTSPTSNLVVFNSVALPSPTVYSIYNPEAGYNILIWNKVEGARGYEIYKDGTKISNPSISEYMGTSYQYIATSAGTYYVIALSDDSFHSSSLASNSVIIETNTSGSVDPVVSVADVVLNAVKSILNLASYLGTFVAVFGNIFAFLPPEVKSLFMTFMIAGIGINVMKWFV